MKDLYITLFREEQMCAWIQNTLMEILCTAKCKPWVNVNIKCKIVCFTSLLILMTQRIHYSETLVTAHKMFLVFCQTVVMTLMCIIHLFRCIKYEKNVLVPLLIL